jgi:hypothetical protein
LNTCTLGTTALTALIVIQITSFACLPVKNRDSKEY